MVLLRSLPEFSTMCISAIDFLGDAMNCKGSMFGTIICNDSSWCDSRDEVIDSQSASDRAHEEDLSGRYSDLLDTQSLSSSVHHLLHDSSQLSFQHATGTRRAPDDDIFRLRKSPKESSCNSLPLNELYRCTAWVQDDFSFESEHPKDESKIKCVRIVHWEDRLSDSDSINLKYGCGIFRRNDVIKGAGNKYVFSIQLNRCSAWSLDDSSLIIGDNISSVRRETSPRGSKANMVHWDELVQGTI